MKLRNKKTGEIGYFCFANWDNPVLIIMDKNGIQLAKYNSLAELNADWGDAPEELKGYWYIDDSGVIQIDQVLSSEINMRKVFGNYFETKEEAEKAVEKLKAFKRLKDKGFRFDRWNNVTAGPYMPIWFYFEEDTALEDVKSDLDLLFSGGEE